MKDLTILIFAIIVLGAMVTASPSFSEPSCSCNITCDNGTSCTASGKAACSCDCDAWFWPWEDDVPGAGDAVCTASGTAAKVIEGGRALLIDNLDAVRVAVEATVSQPGTLLLYLDAASQALVMDDSQSYESAVLEIDSIATWQLPIEEDVAFANALGALISPSDN